jgi:hypothetical protein
MSANYYLDSEGDPMVLNAAEIGALADARLLMSEVARMQPLYEILAKMDAVQQQLDAGKAWETRGGRDLEATRGYLRMMLESADAGMSHLPVPRS